MIGAARERVQKLAGPMAPGGCGLAAGVEEQPPSTTIVMAASAPLPHLLILVSIEVPLRRPTPPS